MRLADEQWRLLSNVDRNQFLISSLGRVFNYKTETFIKWHLHKSRCGVYPRYTFGKRKIMAHVLVGTSFPELVPRHDLACTQLDHLDGNTLNPAASNMAWKTPGDNQRAYQMGRYVTFNGTTYKAIIRKKKSK